MQKILNYNTMNEQDSYVVIPKLSDDERYVSIQNALVRSENIDSATLRVYETILSYRGLSVIRVSQKTLAEQLCCTKQNISKYFTKLKEIGLLEINLKIGANGKYNEYVLVTYEDYAREHFLKIEKGFTFIPYIILCNKNLSNGELRLYSVLKSFAGYGSIRPSLNDLQKYCGNISRPTICSIINSLEKKELIRHERRGDIHYGNSYNEYFINDEYVWNEQHPFIEEAKKEVM